MAKQTELKNLLQDLERATRAHQNMLNLPVDINARNKAFGEADRAEKRVFSFFDALRIEIEESARAYKSLQEQRNHVVQERDEARKAATDWQNAAQKAKADLQELAQQVMAMKPAGVMSPSFNDMYEFSDHAKAAGFNGWTTDAINNGWTIDGLKANGYIKPREQPAPKQGEFVNVTITVKPNEPFNDARARAGDPIEILGGDGKWHERKYIGEFVNSAGIHMITFLYADTAAQARASQVRMKPKAPKQLQMFANLYRNPDGTVRGTLASSAEKAEKRASADRLTNAPIPVTITVAE